MKQIRGTDAVRYAEREGILFNVDEGYLLGAETELLGKSATLHDIQTIFYEKLDRDYDRIDLLPGGESFNLLIERYGDGWIYVPLEGNNPKAEESEALLLFGRALKQEEPHYGGDLLDLATRYLPRLRDTGFPREADLNLLFHAALRLVEKGKLGVITEPEPLPKGAAKSYGKKRFYVQTGVEIRRRT